MIGTHLALKDLNFVVVEAGMNNRNILATSFDGSIYDFRTMHVNGRVEVLLLTILMLPGTAK